MQDYTAVLYLNPSPFLQY